MLETSGRLLKLLSLLQTRRDWSGAALAEHLEVSRRTLRRDVERLRELGYPVHATQGAAGYRLGAGAELPPLLLDDDEAIAVVVGLHTAAGSSVTGIEESSLRALTKLEQVLPSRLRHRVRTLHTATVRAGTPPAPEVSADILMAIAEACRRRERLRFDYTSHQRGHSIRFVEPHSLVSFGRHWYLVAWDNDRADWRTFRVDRLTPRAAVRRGCVRVPPGRRRPAARCRTPHSGTAPGDEEDVLVTGEREDDGLPGGERQVFEVAGRDQAQGPGPGDALSQLEEEGAQLVAVAVPTQQAHVDHVGVRLVDRGLREPGVPRQLGLPEHR